ncbi:MAG: hypothetical protein HKN47_11000 [Pirellulaceae bacterium]|nr:hypothetical protein [Pirellulaceae bacterium]
MEPALIVGASIFGGIALVGGILFAAYKFEQARTEKLKAIADELGLEFFPKGDDSVKNSLGHLQLFNRGHGRRMQNMLSGQSDEIEMAIFGYRYTTGGGKNQQTHQQTVISFQTPALSLPAFELRPEHMFHKIGKVFGYQDINFNSHPVFSKRYLLRGSDEEAIRKLFTADVLAFFESQQGISVEADRDRLIYYRSGKRSKPELLRGFMEEGFRVYGLLQHGSSGA